MKLTCFYFLFLYLNLIPIHISTNILYNDKISNEITTIDYHFDNTSRISLKLNSEYKNHESLKVEAPNHQNVLHQDHHINNTTHIIQVPYRDEVITYFNSINYPVVNSVIDENIDEERIYYVKRVAGAGCPYTASWLIHINLYSKTKIWLDSTKMEAASFLIFDKAPLKFQIADPDAYYVHHMSMYEHLLHKKKGFEVSKNETLIMSQFAFIGECESVQVSHHREILAIIPFYGGLPPNVTNDLTVKSIGQGNSLVDANTKALQTMASICSCLQYFGQVAIGVVRVEDRELLSHMIEMVKPEIQERIQLIQFETIKPAHLPFHLMAWAQTYIQDYNCKGNTIYPNPRDYKIKASLSRRLSKNNNNHFRHRQNGKLTSSSGAGLHHGKHKKTSSYISWSSSTHIYPSYDIYDKDSDVFKICHIHFASHHIGNPVRISYHRLSLIHRHDNDTSSTNNGINPYDNNPILDYHEKYTNFTDLDGSHYLVPINYFHPIRYIYYSESDQIVKFDNMETFRAITTASNDTTFFVGRRKEKSIDTNSKEYLSGLSNWRECGVTGFAIHWPNETFVQHVAME